MLLSGLGVGVEKPLQGTQSMVVAQQIPTPIARAEDADFDHFCFTWECED